MSRKGKAPIHVLKGVEVKITDNEVIVKGPKGSLSQKLVPGIEVKHEGEHILVALAPEANEMDNFHGLYRTLIYNMILGATQGFQETLEMVGVGFRASVQGHNLDLQIGVSHPVKIPIPPGISVKVENNNIIHISGVDKQRVGQFAAFVRAKKKPEPYQGKGIRYKNEFVRKKAGKAAATKK